MPATYEVKINGTSTGVVGTIPAKLKDGAHLTFEHTLSRKFLELLLARLKGPDPREQGFSLIPIKVQHKKRPNKKTAAKRRR